MKLWKVFRPDNDDHIYAIVTAKTRKDAFKVTTFYNDPPWTAGVWIGEAKPNFPEGAVLMHAIERKSR